jgi:hypothetical protein
MLKSKEVFGQEKLRLFLAFVFSRFFVFLSALKSL